MQIESHRFLITGGASLIGLRTAESLLAAGAREVVLYDNLSFDAPDGALAALLETGRVRLVRGDVLDAQAVETACEGIHGVYALAGFMSAGIGKQPRLGLEVNVLGVLNVLDACVARRVGKLVLASSSAVYGYGAIGGAITEAEPLRTHAVPAPPALYGASKLLAEKLCQLYRTGHGLDYVALRYSTVYGERQHYRSTNALYIIDAYDRVARGESPVLYGDGSETKDFVYVGDVARANVLAMRAQVPGEAINIAGGKPLSVRYLAETVIRLAGARVEPEYREAPAAGFRIKTDAPFHYDIGKAERLIGWKPEVPIEEGIARLIAWRRDGTPR
ncbi:NAD-dependent epimerase/dehydratase family protein [Pigmentiphaga sp.]|uniref:NAD-dependent epimerase/dehydratase family protein n=1 Tax=Pigmentiphaga sp. TaxID=1977564 RepID=UPI002600F69B|nr:NAD-dependent epimerase/dehydratase family protein [Pigmentiphaga sp.]